MKTYEEFKEKLHHKLSYDSDIFYDLLVSIIKNPLRYTGIFRTTNAQTKLIQNLTQSREIKFGDFMEDIITEYISDMGYTNLNKNIGTDSDGNPLSADQVFRKNDTIYLIEQKIRDDHDSTKKRGQYDNFQKKYLRLKNDYPNNTIEATMWFIDGNLHKNRSYYTERAASEETPGINIHIIYGGDLFAEHFLREDLWNEIVSHLTQHKTEQGNITLTVPDPDASPEFLDALIQLKSREPRLYAKLLTSQKPEYQQLRAELFPSGQNFHLAEQAS